jgi:hypothetical protein
MLLGRGRSEDNRNQQPSYLRNAASPVAGGEAPSLLLTRRVPDGQEDIPGFREVYFCTTCADYFVLAWHPRSSPLVARCDVVENLPPESAGTDTAAATVFCPKCSSGYAMYGRIEHAEVSPPQPEEALVYESFDYPYPPEFDSHPAGSIQVGKLVIRKIVLFVTGEFPDGLDVLDFACSGFNETVLSRFGGEVVVSEQGGIRLHVLRVSSIVDETDWLVPIINSQAYQAQSARVKLSMTSGLMNLRAPLGQALFCLILIDD